MNNKEEFKRLLKEQELFDKLKDKYVTCEYINGTYCDLDIDHSRLYRRIVNYKIKKYGSSFELKPSYGIFKSIEEYHKLNNKSRYRKRYRLNGK